MEQVQVQKGTNDLIQMLYKGFSPLQYYFDNEEAISERVAKKLSKKLR